MTNYTDYQLSVIKSISKDKDKKEQEFCTLTGVILK
jgi:hypothetical protein